MPMKTWALGGERPVSACPCSAESLPRTSWLGGVAEWSIASDSKSDEPQGSGGSNPFPSARINLRKGLGLGLGPGEALGPEGMRSPGGGRRSKARALRRWALPKATGRSPGAKRSQSLPLRQDTLREVDQLIGWPVGQRWCVGQREGVRTPGGGRRSKALALRRWALPQATGRSSERSEPIPSPPPGMNFKVGRSRVRDRGR